jgi:pSer/pThr/pTyr-binding forkhead associated (FHA) protein
MATSVHERFLKALLISPKPCTLVDLEAETAWLTSGAGIRIAVVNGEAPGAGTLSVRVPSRGRGRDISASQRPGVSESSLTGLVAQVRKALADDRRQERFLSTVHGFGYAFSGEITTAAQEEPGPVARLIWEDSVFVLQPGDNLLGRSEQASVQIDAPGVSRRHARIVVTDDGATIEDLTSKNGTFLCERRLDGPTPLRDGDRLRLGRQLLVFRRTGSAASTRTELPPPVRNA